MLRFVITGKETGMQKPPLMNPGEVMIGRRLTDVYKLGEIGGF